MELDILVEDSLDISAEDNLGILAEGNLDISVDNLGLDILEGNKVGDKRGKPVEDILAVDNWVGHTSVEDSLVLDISAGGTLEDSKEENKQGALENNLNIYESIHTCNLCILVGMQDN